MKSKKLTAKAALTIPKDLRAETGLLGGMAVDLIPQEDGGILIRKHVPACCICGSVEDVTEIKTTGQELCFNCVASVRKDIEAWMG